MRIGSGDVGTHAFSVDARTTPDFGPASFSISNLFGFLICFTNGNLR